ncbi:hypothetical protein Gotur_019755, partial [Gossypium turneri]
FIIEYDVLVFGVKIAVKERNEVIHRNLGGGKPHAFVCHAKSNFAPPRDHGK